jgi:hypothetical protein
MPVRRHHQRNEQAAHPTVAVPKWMDSLEMRVRDCQTQDDALLELLHSIVAEIPNVIVDASAETSWRRWIELGMLNASATYPHHPATRFTRNVLVFGV